MPLSVDHRPSRTLAPLHILLIDDNAADLRQAQEAFAVVRGQVTVRSCQNAQQALCALRAGNVPFPDVVLLDVNLPEGFEVLSAMKADPQWRSIPLVMLTASGSREEGRTTRFSNAYLLKSGDSGAFVGAVQDFLHFWLNNRGDHPVQRVSA